MSANMPFTLNERLRLKCIKLAGFKSFVDPVTVPFPNNLVGVVGPNGCGKSNIIDAVRWVMGESSAKNLRGESGVDVIFNGSTDRKPVGQASVELLFENPNGAIGGEYAQYTEISIRRLITRDGQSTYMLNGTRCRRRDITDIFLGTGLGPRSYSIIEQGMISKLVEAKPEDLRVYLEEAAGISKYKERRRETETRIRNTRDNLDRLNDLREELEKQLERLKRQSEAAIKYKELKIEEHTTRTQLLTLRWQHLSTQLTQVQQQIQAQEIAMEAIIADQRNADAIIEQLREQHSVASDEWQDVQQHFYGVGAQVARIEQNLQHIKERIEQLQHDEERAENDLQQNERHLTDDRQRITDITALLSEITPETELLEASAEQSSDMLNQAEQQMQDWQTQWDQFNQDAASSSQQAHVEQTRIQHYEQTLQQAKQRTERLQEECNLLQPTELHDALTLLREQIAEAQFEQETTQNHLQLLNDKSQQTRHHLQHLQHTLEGLHSERSKQEGRKASLEALQQAALGKSNHAIQRWLEQHNLAKNTRLAEQLSVETGWEKAVETVLGQALQAVCVDDIAPAAALLASLEQGNIMLYGKQAKTIAATVNSLPLLMHKVQGDHSLASLLANIYIAEDLATALQIIESLAPEASVITADGVWLSHQWVRVWRDKDEQAGVLQRNQDLQNITTIIADVTSRIAALEDELSKTRDSLQDMEAQRDTHQQALTQLANRTSMLQADQRVRDNRLEQQTQRQRQIETELKELIETQQDLHLKLTEARATWQNAMTAMEQDADRRQQLQQARDAMRQQLDTARQRHREDKERFHQLQIKHQNLSTELHSKQQNQQRMQQQIDSLRERCIYLKQAISETRAPAPELEMQLEESLEQRIEADDNLRSAKQRVEEIDYQIRQQEQRRHQAEAQSNALRNQLEQLRLTSQGEQVRQQNIIEQLLALEVDPRTVAETLPAEATEAAMEEELQRVLSKIQRLGAINLAAIEEFNTESERKNYIDAQHADLLEALDTLEGAIAKIDRETRAKFKETFEIVNTSFQALFPKIFGGGSSYLELTSEDLLDTGVTVMARPPGKKNSTIHLLSGGEKALTAIALVFSIFQLNPAPFCMLDEVDAPLDDANVGRYCSLIKEMASSVQFIFISHNKLAIEMAESLNGVTMKEPGVSRLVSVNMEEAIAMADA